MNETYMQPCSKEKEIQEIRDMTVAHNISFEYVKKSIDIIENNHLAHMQASLDSMEQKINSCFKPLEVRIEVLEKLSYKVIAWAAVGAFIGGIIIQLAFKYL